MPGRDFKFRPTVNGAAVALQSEALERALFLGKAGTISATETDAADFLVQVPFNLALLRLKVTCKTAPGGAMVVQLRRSTNPTTPSWADVTGFTVTFTAAQVSAVADPANVDVNEGDLLNFSASTGSGSNLLVEVVAAIR